MFHHGFVKAGFCRQHYLVTDYQYSPLIPAAGRFSALRHRERGGNKVCNQPMSAVGPTAPPNPKKRYTIGADAASAMSVVVRLPSFAVVGIEA